MGRKFGKKEPVKVDFANYSYMLNGEGSVGKTTLAVETGEELYGEDGYLLVTVGKEPQPKHIGYVNKETTKDWDELEELIDDLIEERNENPDLKLIIIDSIDEVYRLAEAKVIDEYNRTVEVSKRTTSIKGAWSGYGAGERRAVEKVVNLLFAIPDANYGLIIIGHVKKKSDKDIISDVEFEVITSDLPHNYYSSIKNKVNLVATAYIEREMNGIEEIKDAFNRGKTKQVGRVASEQRIVSFVSDENVDMKSHFRFIEPKCILNAEDFISTIMTAIDKQAEYYENKREKRLSKKGKEDMPKIEVVVVEVEVDTKKNKKLIKQISELAKEAKDADKMNKMKKVLEKHEASKLSDETKPTKMFEEILKIFEGK